MAITPGTTLGSFEIVDLLGAGIDGGVLTNLAGALRPQGPGYDIGPYERLAVGN